MKNQKNTQIQLFPVEKKEPKMKGKKKKCKWEELGYDRPLTLFDH